MANDFIISFRTRAGSNVTVVSKNRAAEATCSGCNTMCLPPGGSQQAATNWAERHASECDQ
ncbi:hypothetical protein [Streptomyces sp. NPDC012888]|uniref:hypothetical protein n=1 Tax=Streptomyces sp. NPDC012888 TaxID=3364855 RepID=UPI003698CE29